MLITGGTGSLGQALTRRLLQTDVETIRIISREEFKQVQMQSELSDSRLRFFIGDIRDKDRLKRALEDVDIVIHAAALKHVPIAEYNPTEAVKTNVYGSENLIETCLDSDVENVLAIGTDKAVSPFNTYGATKLLMERLFVAANNFKGFHKTKFSCVRYGNVLGSRGSLVPTLVNQIKTGKEVTITDPNMTRFNITMNQALDLILRSLQNMIGGEVFVPKLRAYRTGDVKDALFEILDAKNKIKLIPVRPGEKYHESLISHEEIRNTYENDIDYLILDQQTQITMPLKNKLFKSSIDKEYSSNNVDLLSKDDLKNILITENLININ